MRLNLINAIKILKMRRQTLLKVTIPQFNHREIIPGSTIGVLGRRGSGKSYL